MLPKKRLLKKDRLKKKYRTLIFFEIVLIILLIIIEIAYLLAFASKINVISPLAIVSNPPVSSIEKELKNTGIDYAKLSLNSDLSYTLELKDGAIVYFSSQKKVSEQIASLQLILSRTKIEGKRLKSLNFKYDNPVIKF